LIDPGKPWQNGVCESCNGKFRDECLSLEWFPSRAEAKVVIETWRRHDNAVRPHSSLGYLTPATFGAQAERPAPRDATGRDAAVSEASAPRPVASPPRQGQEPQPQVNHGPKKRAGQRHRVEIRGELAAILSLAQGARDASYGRNAAVLAEQVKMVAGTRNHLCRTRFFAPPGRRNVRLAGRLDPQPS
jgi:putative transposase